MDDARPIFSADITVPMRLTRMQEVFHPSGGRHHAHWFYEFEPDMAQADLRESQRTLDTSEYDLEALMDYDNPQRAVFGPFRVGTRRPTELGVGDLFDVILVRREPLPVPDLSESALGRLMARIFGGGEEVGNNLVAIVPLMDMEAAEYDAAPDIEGLPDLMHLSEEWPHMTIVQRLSAIAQARAEQQ